jgi:hypothetical protein
MITISITLEATKRTSLSVILNSRVKWLTYEVVLEAEVDTDQDLGWAALAQQ